MNKHTPGPWHVGSRIDCQSTRICTIVGGDAIHGAGNAVSEWRADAALIAAAPDLLEALERLVSAARDVDHGYMDQAIDNAESAIAKARGEA